MAAINDNVVFTDTSDESMVWQRARLIALLDLPRPEVLMNVWSYQASSPDGREILRSSERVRDLVNAQNDALQDAIQFGWAYLSREMEKQITCTNACKNGPDDGAQKAEPKRPTGPAGDPMEMFRDPQQEQVSSKITYDLAVQGVAAAQEARTAAEAIAATAQAKVAAAETEAAGMRQVYVGALNAMGTAPKGTATEAKTAVDTAIVKLRDADEALGARRQELQNAQEALFAARNNELAAERRLTAAKDAMATATADSAVTPATLAAKKEALETAQKQADYVERMARAAAAAKRKAEEAASHLKESAVSLRQISEYLKSAQEADSRKNQDGFKPVLQLLAGIQPNPVLDEEVSRFNQQLAELKARLEGMKGAGASRNRSRRMQALDSAIGIVDQLQTDIANLHAAQQPQQALDDARQKFPDAGRKLAEAQTAYDKEKLVLDQSAGAKSAIRPFFDASFYDYITQKFVQDDSDFLGGMARQEWGFCPRDRYCLGYTQAFQPVRPNLTSVLLGAIAAKDPLRTILTTIGCMEGKYEVYPECFPQRGAINALIAKSAAVTALVKEGKRADGSTLRRKSSADPCLNCEEITTWTEEAKSGVIGSASAADKRVREASEQELALADSEVVRACIRRERNRLIATPRYRDNLSCEALDRLALEAQDRCGVPQTLPLSCFTLQAAQSFSSNTDFSTFTLKSLNELAEVRLADIRPDSNAYRADAVGLLRAAIADFLFNYKMSQEYPKEFTPYELQHSAQELNAELNPLIVSFNQDVAAFSRHISDRLDKEAPNQKSFMSDGIITIRGIGGDYSSVDTVTLSYFPVTQARALSDVLNTLTGQGQAPAGAGQAASAAPSPLAALQKGTVNPTTAIAALGAIAPQTFQAQVGRQLTFYVTPYTLPGASSAELQVSLTAADSPNAPMYASGGSNQTDPVSHIGRFAVTSRVRVESVKMFELSSFTALVQHPRNKVPLLPPLIELPWVGSFARLPLPGARSYHRSTAIVSAVLVPTATDLAYGLEFVPDRLVTPRPPEAPPTVDSYLMRTVNSQSQFKNLPIRSFHRAVVSCLATGQKMALPSGYKGGCENLTFQNLPREF